MQYCVARDPKDYSAFIQRQRLGLVNEGRQENSQKRQGGEKLYLSSSVVTDDAISACVELFQWYQPDEIRMM
jgi:hypothetical protein